MKTMAKYGIFLALGILLGVKGWFAWNSWEFWAWFLFLDGLIHLRDWGMAPNAGNHGPA